MQTNQKHQADKISFYTLQRPEYKKLMTLEQK